MYATAVAVAMNGVSMLREMQQWNAGATVTDMCVAVLLKGGRMRALLTTTLVNTEKDYKVILRRGYKTPSFDLCFRISLKGPLKEQNTGGLAK